MESYTGQINAFAFNFAPQDWMICEGQILQVQQNMALFALLGNFYGGIDNRTFGLPDLRGRTMLGAGTAASGTNYNLGEAGGAETVILTSIQMPTHAHLLNANGVAGAGSEGSPTGAYLAGTTDPNTGSGLTIYSPTSDSTMSAQAIGNAGASQPHPNMPPFVAMKYCISVQGYFPSRN